MAHQEITDNTKAVEGIQLFNGENDVTSGALEVTEGSTLNLTPKVLPEDATQDVTWSSSHPDDVEVQDGHVTVLHVPANNEPVVITATPGTSFLIPHSDSLRISCPSLS